MVHEGTNQVSMSGVIPSYTYLVIYLIKPLSVRQIIDQILGHSTSTVAEDRESFMSMLRDDEDGSSLNMVGFKYSLLDPLTYQRMEHPVRSLHCKHVKCFDLRAFVELYSNKEKMECPVCYEAVRLDELKEDVFVWDILKHTNKDEEEVELELSGEWHHCQVDLTPPPSPTQNLGVHEHDETSSSKCGTDSSLYSSQQQLSSKQSQQQLNSYPSKQQLSSSQSKSQLNPNQPKQQLSSNQSKQQLNSYQPKLPITTPYTSFDYILDEFCANRRKRKSLITPSIDTFFSNKRDSRSQETNRTSPLTMGSELYVKSNSAVSSMKWGNDRSLVKSKPVISAMKLNSGVHLVKSTSDKPSNPVIIDLCDDSSDEQTCNSIEDCVISLVDLTICYKNHSSFHEFISQLSPTGCNRILQRQHSINRITLHRTHQSHKHQKEIPFPHPERGRRFDSCRYSRKQIVTMLLPLDHGRLPSAVFVNNDVSIWNSPSPEQHLIGIDFVLDLVE